MLLHLHSILPALQPYVKLICTMECDSDADTRHIRVLPDTCVELFINYTNTPVAVIDNELHQRSIVTFRMSKPMEVQMRKGSGCLAICFYPGAAYRFFKLPMHALTDTTTAFSELWKEAATELEERIADAKDNETRVALAQQYLLQQLAHTEEDKQINYCLHKAENTNGELSVQQLTDDTGISQRQLSRRFQQCVGLSPKEYLKVSRFVQSLQHLKQYPSRSLTEIAYLSGYYDQAHFIRDYKQFAGSTPGEVAQSQSILY